MVLRLCALAPLALSRDRALCSLRGRTPLFRILVREVLPDLLQTKDAGAQWRTFKRLYQCRTWREWSFILRGAPLAQRRRTRGPCGLLRRRTRLAPVGARPSNALAPMVGTC